MKNPQEPLQQQSGSHPSQTNAAFYWCSKLGQLCSLNSRESVPGLAIRIECFQQGAWKFGSGTALKSKNPLPDFKLCAGILLRAAVAAVESNACNNVGGACADSAVIPKPCVRQYPAALECPIISRRLRAASVVFAEVVGVNSSEICS